MDILTNSSRILQSHWQATPPNTQTQTCQRVCLVHLSTKPTEKRMDKGEARCRNSVKQCLHPWLFN